MSATQTLSFTCPQCHTIVDVMPRSGEELLTCPHCNKPFQVKVPEAEPVNQLVLPAHLEATHLANGAAAGTECETEKQPLVAEHLVAEHTVDKEEHLATVHLDMFRRYPLRCLGYLLVIVGGAIFGIVAFVHDWPLVGVLLFILAGLALARFASWGLRMKNTVFMITTHRCIVETGILTKKTTEIPMKDIAEIQMSQNFLTRLFNVGDLILISAGAQRKQLVVMAVPNPTEVAARIRGQGLGKESVPK